MGAGETLPWTGARERLEPKSFRKARMWVLPRTGACPAASARSGAPVNLDGLSGAGPVHRLPLLLPASFTVCRCSSCFCKDVCMCLWLPVSFAAPGPSELQRMGLLPSCGARASR